MIKQYVKKPVVINAIQFTGNNIQELVNWVDKSYLPCGDETQLIITTLEGDMFASVNDYIIKGVKGEFYPCKPDIFSLTYEEVTDRGF